MLFGGGILPHRKQNIHQLAHTADGSQHNLYDEHTAQFVVDCCNRSCLQVGGPTGEVKAVCSEQGMGTLPAAWPAPDWNLISVESTGSDTPPKKKGAHHAHNQPWTCDDGGVWMGKNGPQRIGKNALEKGVGGTY